MSDRTYEIIFIADPDLPETEVDTITNQVQGFVEKEGGRISKVEKWGKKRLAYTVGRHREGYYVLLVAEGPGSVVKEVERKIRVLDGVIRFLTVRVDEELKKAERRKAKRAAEEAKRPKRPTPERPAMPSYEGEGVQS